MGMSDTGPGPGFVVFNGSRTGDMGIDVQIPERIARQTFQYTIIIFLPFQLTLDRMRRALDICWPWTNRRGGRGRKTVENQIGAHGPPSFRASAFLSEL